MNLVAFPLEKYKIVFKDIDKIIENILEYIYNNNNRDLTKYIKKYNNFEGVLDQILVELNDYGIDDDIIKLFAIIDMLKTEKEFDYNNVLSTYYPRMRMSIIDKIITQFNSQENLSELGTKTDCNGTDFIFNDTIKDRIKSIAPRQAFHLTNINNFFNIYNNDFECRGVGGVTQGSAVYFCSRPMDCIVKVANKSHLRMVTEDESLLFDVDLYMGNPFYTDNWNRGTHPIFDNYDQRLGDIKHDSVIYHSPTGIEYIVYRPAQIVIKKIYRLNINEIKKKLVKPVNMEAGEYKIDKNKELIKTGFELTRNESFDIINRYINRGGKIVDRYLFEENIHPYYYFKSKSKSKSKTKKTKKTKSKSKTKSKTKSKSKKTKSKSKSKSKTKSKKK